MRHADALHLTPSLAAVVCAGVLGACANEVEDEGAVMSAGVVESAAEKAFTRTCAAGSTVKGIDVSYYQSNIDWAQVADDGVQYAFIRVSDGLGHVDSKFERNWAGARDQGILRGAYQFFRSNQDPIAQAELLIEKVGQLEAGDLPPVIDVESKDGQSAQTIARKVGQWLDHVEAALGVRPIIYTGPYFWRDQVGGADFDDHALWIAHYGTSCPYVPATWTSWTFHQHSSSGRVRGISGNVDMNLFNGTLNQLRALTVAGTPQPPPPPPPPPANEACAELGSTGGTIDDGGPCFLAGGDPRWLNRVAGAGFDGDLISTGTTASSTTENYAEWTLKVADEGTYELEVFVDGSRATSRQARYRITHADGSTDATINQDSSSGWISIGAYRLRTGAGQKVRLNDNTGENSSYNRDLVFDALRVSRVDDSAPPADECPRVEVFGTGSYLNVRPAPNTSRAAVGRLEDGDIVDRLDTVTGQSVQGSSTWYRITDGQVSGYITAAYARCVE
ncbi:MAG: SH3 domain-containing protein [Deltaproteobacteria bacterium]|nr:SH3 domain-containing protein [Deltaproteobacteria bacterium]